MSLTQLVPRNVKLQMLEKMRKQAQEKEKMKKQEQEKEKMKAEEAKKEDLIKKSKDPPEYSSSSSISDAMEVRIRRSCLQEKIFAMQCEKANKKNAEQKALVSSSSSFEVQNCRKKQNNSRHQNYREKSSKPKYSQDTKRSSKNCQEKPSRQKHSQDTQKSSNDYHEKFLKHIHSQNGSKTSNPRPTAFSFSVPSDKLSTRFSYAQSISEKETVTVKPSFILLQDRPLEDPREKSFVVKNLKNSDAESSEGSPPVLCKSNPNSLTSAKCSLKKLQASKTIEKKKEKAINTLMDESRENLHQSTLSHQKTPLMKETQNGTSSRTDHLDQDLSEKSSDLESFSNFDKDETKDGDKVSISFIKKQSRKNYYECRGKFEPIDWSGMKSITNSPSNPSKKENSFSLSSDKLNARFSLGQSNLETKSSSIKPFSALLQNRSFEDSRKTFFVAKNFKSFNTKLSKEISSVLSESDSSLELSLSNHINQVEASSQNFSETREKTDTLATQNKENLKKESSHQKTFLTTYEEKKESQSNTYSRSDRFDLSEKSSDLESLSYFNRNKKKKSMKESNEGPLHLQKPLDDGEQNLKRYYNNRGKLEPINWDNMSKPSRLSNENHTGVFSNRSREPNELLKTYSLDKPNVTVESVEFFYFVDNTIDYQTTFEVKGNIEKNPRAMNDPIEQIQRQIHGNGWNVCYLPKEMQTCFKRNVQKSSIAASSTVIDYTQTKKTSKSLPVKTIPKKQQKSPKETHGPNYTLNVTSSARYEEKVEIEKPQAVRELKSSIAASKTYKRAVHDYTDDMFEFDLPKSKSSSRINTTLNSTLDSDDTQPQKSSELDDSAIIKEFQTSPPNKSMFEVLKKAVGSGIVPRPPSKISYTAAAQEAKNKAQKSINELSLTNKCIKYLSEYNIDESAIEEKPIKIEEIKMPKREEVFLKAVSTRYFSEEQKKEQLIKEQKDNSSDSLNTIPSIDSENFKENETNSDVPQKIVEIKNEVTYEKSIETSCTVKSPLTIFSDSSDNNPKSSSDNENENDNYIISDLNETKSSSVIMKEIVSDHELDKIEDKPEPVTEQQSQNGDEYIDEIDGFDVVGDFTNHFINIKSAQKHVEDIRSMIKQGPNTSVVNTTNSNSNPSNLFGNNIFENVDVDEWEKCVAGYRDSSVSELTKADNKNLKTLPAGMSGRKKKKLEWIAKAQNHFKNVEELKVA